MSPERFNPRYSYQESRWARYDQFSKLMTICDYCRESCLLDCCKIKLKARKNIKISILNCGDEIVYSSQQPYLISRSGKLYRVGDNV